MTSTNEVEAMARYLLEVRRVTGKWPTALVLHPTASVEVVKEAIELAKRSITR